MITKKHFLHQTGNISYSVSIRPYETTGSFSFGLGGSGVTDQVNFNGISGFLYDNDGLYFGSYSKSNSFTVSGNIIDNKSNYHLNGTLIRSNIGITGGHLNYFYFSGQSLLPENVSVKINGQQNYLSNKTILYVTQNEAAEQSIIDLTKSIANTEVSGLIDVSYNCSQFESISEKDLVIFGLYNTGEYTNSGKWSQIKSPIISLSQNSVNQSGMNWISGGNSLINQTRSVSKAGSSSFLNNSISFPSYLYNTSGQVMFSQEPIDSTFLISQRQNVSPSTMTSNSSPAPYQASSSAIYSGEATGLNAYKAFDGNSTYLNSCFLSGTGYIAIDLSEPAYVNRYSLNFSHYFTTYNYGVSWNLEGSNNAVDWNILDSRSGNSTTLQTLSYNLSSGFSYSNYRINFTERSSNGVGICVGEISLSNTLDVGIDYQDLQSGRRLLLQTPQNKYLNSMVADGFSDAPMDGTYYNTGEVWALNDYPLWRKAEDSTNVANFDETYGWYLGIQIAPMTTLITYYSKNLNSGLSSPTGLDWYYAIGEVLDSDATVSTLDYSDYMYSESFKRVFSDVVVDCLNNNAGSVGFC